MKEISAGGVVYRLEDGQVKLLIIIDRYNKISIPKGKQEAGETLEETAIREIKEETGIDGKIIGLLETVYYQYHDPVRGVIDKEVTYYLVEATGGKLDVQLEEINQVFWEDWQQVEQLQREKGYANNQPIFDQARTLLDSL